MLQGKKVTAVFVLFAVVSGLFVPAVMVSISKPSKQWELFSEEMFHLFDHVVLRFRWDVVLPRLVCLLRTSCLHEHKLNVADAYLSAAADVCLDLSFFLSQCSKGSFISVTDTVAFCLQLHTGVHPKWPHPKCCVMQCQCSACVQKLDHLLERHKLVVVFVVVAVAVLQTFL